MNAAEHFERKPSTPGKWRQRLGILLACTATGCAPDKPPKDPIPVVVVDLNAPAESVIDEESDIVGESLPALRANCKNFKDWDEEMEQVQGGHRPPDLPGPFFDKDFIVARELEPRYEQTMKLTSDLIELIRQRLYAPEEEVMVSKALSQQKEELEAFNHLYCQSASTSVFHSRYLRWLANHDSRVTKSPGTQANVDESIGDVEGHLAYFQKRITDIARLSKKLDEVCMKWEQARR